MLLTTQRDTSFYPAATMEMAGDATENSIYSNIGNTRTDKPSGYPTDPYAGTPNDKVSKVRADIQKMGPGITLKVMAGDQFSVRVSSWYKLPSGTTHESPWGSIADIVFMMNHTAGAVSGGKTDLATLQASGVFESGATQFLTDNYSGASSGKPRAFLNWILFDEQFKYVAASSGAEQVGNDNVLTSHTRNNMPIAKSGYLYIYVCNETPNVDVFFDNLQVTHIRGPILEETHYYPFGLTMAGISSKALAFGKSENKMKFNGIEQNNDFDLNMYDAFYRNLDPQIGRFWQIDPKPNENFSSYAAMVNNPILFSDPLGDTTWLFNQRGHYSGVVNDDLPNQVHFLNLDGDPGTPLDLSSLTQEQVNAYGDAFRKISVAFMGANTAADMEKISKVADEKGFELGFVAEVSESKEIRLTQLPEKYRSGDKSYDLLQAINDNYTKEQQSKLFGAGHVHNKKHVADLTGYDGHTGVMAKFLRLNTPSAANNGGRTYPDYQPFLYRYDPSTRSYNKGQTPAFIISAYGVTTYGTGTGYGGLNNAVQNPVMPNEYKSYLLYKQLKK